MTSKKGFSLRPAVKSEEREETYEEMQKFIAEGGMYPDRKENYPPWEEVYVRDDLVKAVNLRLSEPYLIRLAYISNKTNLSQQEILRRAVMPYLEKEGDKYWELQD